MVVPAWTHASPLNAAASLGTREHSANHVNTWIHKLFSALSIMSNDNQQFYTWYSPPFMVKIEGYIAQ